MDKRGSIFRVSIVLNALLAALVVWLYLNVNYLKDQVTLSEIQYNFLKLESLIEKQSDNNWNEPYLVTIHMKNVIDGVWLATKGETLSDEDEVMFHRLHQKLITYPYNEENGSSELTEQDRKKYEELRAILHGVRTRSTVQVSDRGDGNRNFILSQTAEIESSIETKEFK